MPGRRQILVLALVLATHVLVILALLLPHSRESTVTESDTVTTVVFFFPPEREPPRQILPDAPQRLQVPANRPPADRQALQPSDSITLPEEEPATPPAVNWRDEAARAAANTLLEGNEAARQGAALNPHGGIPMGEQNPAHTPGIAWDLTHTQRVEILPEGGTLIRLNDHCVLVIPFPMPICQVGKIEARGDLFDHMNELPQDLTRPSTP